MKKARDKPFRGSRAKIRRVGARKRQAPGAANPGRTANLAKITIHHFSDILCVWAYVSEVRIHELKSNFGNQVALDFRTLGVFGNVQGKMESAWGSKGGLSGYAKHVQQVAAQFPHVAIHPQLWMKQTPRSSLPGHLYLCAVRLAEQATIARPGSYEGFATRLRTAFFAEASDISDASVIRSLLSQMSIPASKVESFISSGAAHAKLAEDMQMAKELEIKSSPALIFNEGRQRLTGNVGYRIIEANIRELLERPVTQHSWC